MSTLSDLQFIKLVKSQEEIAKQNEIQNLLTLNDMAHVDTVFRAEALGRAIDLLGLR